MAGRSRLLSLFVLAGALVASACSSSDEPAVRAGLAQGCTINSDCENPLVCAFSRCHTGCESSRDCAAGERCMASDRPFHVCQLEQETKCAYNSQCPAGQVCGTDGECRDQCASARDCVAPQVCVGGTCAESSELDGGQLPPATPSDGGPNDPAGSPCQYNSQCAAGLVCRGGLCIAECLADIDCENEWRCLAGRCVGASSDGGLSDAGGSSDAGTPDASTPSTCSNGVQDGGETDVDCGGGRCPPCATGSGCGASGDCASGNCAGSACQAPTCSDQLRNGGETDVDCGGSDCAACATGNACKAGADCQSGLCIGGHCHALDCSDGRLDNAETDIDCGGGSCAACDNNKRCRVGADCKSSVCANERCQGTGCADGAANGSETDVDCGGGSCAPCAAGGGCNLAGDCATGVCANHVCQVAACSDSALNGSETDLDCGGGSCPKCGDGKQCLRDADCTSSACVNGSCKPTFSLTVTLAGGGTGTVSSQPAGIACGASCSASFPAGTGVSLSASAGLNSVFSGWSGAGCSGTGTCIATLSTAQAVTATFAPSATGALNWVKTLPPSSGSSVGTAIAFDGSGNALAVGNFSSTVDFGAGAIAPTSSSDGYVAKYSASGAYIWARHFGQSFGASMSGVAALSNGDVLVTGTSKGGIALGDSALTNCAGATSYEQGFVARYAAATGAFIWARCQGGTTFKTTAAGGAIASNGDVVVAGSFAGKVDFGGKTLTTAGSDDIFVARYAPADGALISVVQFGDIGSEAPSAVALDPSDNVLLAGGVSGNVSLGGATVLTPGFSVDGFLAKYSAAGAYIWGKMLGDAGSDRIYGVATDAQGNVGYAGYFAGQIDPGGGPLTSVSAFDMVVGKYAPNGGYLWAKRFGGSGDDVPGAVAMHANGDLVFTGYAHSSLDFGGGPVPAPGAGDMVVVKLGSASGAYVWSNGYGSTQDDSGNGVAIAASGSVLLTGNVGGAVDYGSGAQPFSGSSAAFLLKLTP